MSFSLSEILGSSSSVKNEGKREGVTKVQSFTGLKHSQSAGKKRLKSVFRFANTFWDKNNLENCGFRTAYVAKTNKVFLIMVKDTETASGYEPVLLKRTAKTQGNKSNLVTSNVLEKQLASAGIFVEKGESELMASKPFNQFFALTKVETEANPNIVAIFEVTADTGVVETEEEVAADEADDISAPEEPTFDLGSI